jgi:hypothetical protein
MTHHRRLLVLFISLTLRLDETASINKIRVAVFYDFIQITHFSLRQQFNKLHSNCEQNCLQTVIRSIPYRIRFQLKLTFKRRNFLLYFRPSCI